MWNTRALWDLTYGAGVPRTQPAARQRAARASATSRLVVAIALAVAAPVLTACAFFPPIEGPEEQVRFPVTYTADPVLADADWAGTEVTLRSDGTASLIRYPMGSLDENGRGGVCLNWDGATLHTGSASWSLDNGVRLRISTGEADSVLSAGSQGMGQTNWTYDLGVGFCDGGEDLLFVTEDALP